MENNKSYLERMLPAFLIIAGGAVATEVFKKVFMNDLNFYNSSLLITIIFSIPVICFCIALGQITLKWKAAIGALAIYVMVIVAQAFLLRKFFTLESDNAGLVIVVYQIMNVLPYFFFFIFCQVPSSKIPIIGLALLIMQIGGNMAYMPERGLEALGDLFDIRINIPEYIMSFLGMIAGLGFKLIILCELLNYASGKNIGWNTKLLNPGNRYSKVAGSIVFYTLKSTIFFTILGSIGMIYTIAYFLSSPASGMSGMKWQFINAFIFAIPFLYGAAWYLRKFLLEFFMSYGIHSKFHYWLLLLPGIGFIIWLFTIAERKEQTEYREKESNIREFMSSSAEAIVVVFIILLSLRTIFALTSNPSALFLVTIVISLALFLWMYKDRIGYYVNLGLTGLVLFLILIFMIFGKSEATLIALYPFLLLNGVQLFLVYPAFHFEDFSYMTEEEEKPWEPGQDLFG